MNFRFLIILLASAVSGFPQAEPPRLNGTPVVATNNGPHWVTSTGSAVARKIQDRFLVRQDIRDFGSTVTWTTVSNAAVAVNARGGGTLVFPPGTYTFTNTIAIQDGVKFEAELPGKAIFDFSSLALTNEAISAEGSLTALPNLGADVARGQTNITFGSAHGLAAGDVFAVHNTNEYSFGKTDAGQSGRAFYYDGEWFEVATVLSSTEVSVTGPSYSTYTGSTNKLWKLNPVTVAFSGIKMQFKQGFGTAIPGIYIKHGKDVVIENCDLSGSQFAQIHLDRSYRTTVQSTRFFDAQGSVGNNYGIDVANCQKVQILNCSGETTRHAITFGGGTGDAAVVNRELLVQGGYYGSIGTSWGIDFHGNCEYYQVTDVYSLGGLVVGGDHFNISGNYLGNWNNSGYAFAASEMIGLNGTVGPNRYFAVQDFNTGLLNFFARTNLTRKSVLVIRDADMDLGPFTSTTYPSAETIGMYFGTIGDLPNDDLTVHIINPTLRTENTAAGPFYALLYATDGTSGFKRLNIDNPRFDGAGIRLARNIGEVRINGAEIHDSPEAGIRIANVATPSYTNQKWWLAGGTILGAQQAGILASGDTNTWEMTIRDMDIRNNSQVATNTHYSITVSGIKTLTIQDVALGDDQVAYDQAGTYNVSTATRFNRIRVRNVGDGINSLTHASHSAVETLRDDPPLDGPIWDYDAKSFEWGGDGATYATPYLFTRSTNAFVQMILANQPAAGNTIAGVGLSVRAGETGNAASGTLAAYPQDYTISQLAGKAGVRLNADADALVLYAPEVAQTIDIYAGGTTRNGRWGTSGLILDGLTANRVVVTDGNKLLVSSTADTNDLNYISTVTSDVQTQINNRQPLDSDLTTISTVNPGNNYYYGTDGSGTKGFYTFPSAVTMTNYATFAMSDLSTALTSGGDKAYWRPLYKIQIIDIKASVLTASSSGAITLDVEEGGTTIFSTPLTIDESETDSSTAATPAVISDTTIAAHALLTFDIDAEGANAAGLQITFSYIRVP